MANGVVPRQTQKGDSVSIRNRFVLGAAAVLAVAGGTLVAAGPASAAPAYCPGGYACTWGDTNWATSGNSAANIKFTKYIPDYSGWVYAGTKTNGAETASSVFNNGNQDAAFFYKNPSKGGASFRLTRNTGDSNLHDSSGVPGGYQDTLSSGYFDTYN